MPPSRSTAGWLLLFSAALAPLPSLAQANLVPNGSFTDKEPLNTFRYDFPYQDWYKKNVGYVHETTMAGRKCAEIALPPGVGGNEGGKIETALIPAEPGATYYAEIECYLPEFSAMLHAEAFAVDPRDEAARQIAEAKGARLTVQRIPPLNGKPALVMIYRAQLPVPAKGAKWTKVGREFTIPAEWPIGTDGKIKVKPAFISLKAYTFEGSMAAGKSYFTGFKLTKLDVHRPPPTPGGTNGTWSNDGQQKGIEHELGLGPDKKPAPQKKPDAAPLDNIKGAFD
jgi:hypothetical protein